MPKASHVSARRRHRWPTGPGLPLSIAAVLGVLAFWQGAEPTASGLLQDSSEYLTVSGRSGRGDSEVLWLLDTRSEELIVVDWDRTSRTIAPLGRRSIGADVQTAVRGR